MIVFQAAYRNEARTVMEAFGMKQQEGGRFPVFIDCTRTHALILSGEGPLKAYASVIMGLESLKEMNPDGLISFGLAASLKERTGLFRINRMLSTLDGRCFYPDILSASSMREASLISGSLVYHGNLRDVVPEQIMKEKDLSSFDLYDMESAAVYSAASLSLPPHRMQFFRIVSDFGDIGHPDQKMLQDLAGLLTDSVMAACRELEESSQPDWQMSQEAEIYAEKLHCSVTMKSELFHLIHYAALAGYDWKKILEELLQADIKDRQQGKEVLHVFAETICQ